MTLDDYLTRKSLTKTKFAGMVGVSVATISRISCGINPPDWDTMVSIYKVTGGKVTPNDFLKGLLP